VLLGNTGCLKNIVFQLLFCAPGVQNKERHQKHSLILALKFFEQGFRIPPVSCQIGRDDVNIIPGTDGFFLLLDLAAIQFGDGALDRLDSTVLIDTLNVHGDDLGRIHVQKILQKLVADVGCRDAQKAGGAKNAAHLEGAAVLEGKGGRRNSILHRKPTFYEVFPVEVKLAGTVHVEHIVHEFQPLDTVQGLCLHPQSVKVVEQIVLDVVEPGLDLRHAFTLHTKGDELGLSQTIIALGKLLTQHLRILGANIVKAIFLVRDADALLKLCAVRCHVHKGQFKLDAGIEEVQETAPFLENGGLVLLLGELIIDVLILDSAGVVVGFYPAGAILEHPLHGDGLLCCPGNSRLRRLFLAALIGLFPKRHWLTLLSSKSRSSCWSYKVESSGARIAPEHSATAVFPAADHFSRTSQGRTPAASPPSYRGWQQCCRRNPGEQKTAALQ